MDLNLFARVVRRHKVVAIAGFVVALVLAALSFIRVGYSEGSVSVAYRQSEDWASETRLLITQPGFTWGSSSAAGFQQDVERRLIELATIYSGFATSDDVLQIVRSGGPLRGKISAYAVTSRDDQVLPIIGITALTSTAQGARDLSARAADALREFVQRRQVENEIPESSRVDLQVLNRAAPAQLITPRSKTLPIVVLLTVLLATVGLCFVLENLNPRQSEQELDLDAGTPDTENVVAVQGDSMSRGRTNPVGQARRHRAGRRT
jgi:hypothetical protein